MMELAALSFLGFSAQPPTPEWGAMLNEGRAFMGSAPWLMIYPGLAIFITVVVFNMLGVLGRGQADRHLSSPRFVSGAEIRVSETETISIFWQVFKTAATPQLSYV